MTTDRSDTVAEPPEPATQLVVLGSSAGGIEALSTLVSALPDTFRAAIVIAQHLDPRRPSHLAEILSRKTSLAVHDVAEFEPLVAGTIFVVPSNRNVEITGHSVRLLPGDSLSKPSVDVLFTSAAESFHDQLIAVVLTGTGSDGAIGAQVVHDAGGTVIAQDPDTAAFSGMPRSLSPSVVDMFAPLEQIAPLLVSLTTRGDVSAEEEQDLRAVLEDIRERRGVDFTAYRRPTIARRTQRRLVATNSDTLADYRRYLHDHRDEELRFINSLLVKVTEFFRDSETFDYLGQVVVPKLINEANAGNRDLRLWSAGCATGEEAYSLAILAAEAVRTGLSAEPSAVRIFATDLDAGAIAFARRGVYPSSALDRLPRELVERYFVERDGEFEIVDAIRELIIFGEHHMGERPPFPHTDLVLCRNVLMYFTIELQKRALQAFAFSLREGGYLVVGGAENVRPFPDAFDVEDARFRVFRRNNARIGPVPQRGGAAGWSPQTEGRRETVAPRASDQVPMSPGSDPVRSLLDELPVGLVVVDPRYDIQFINRAARDMLGVHGLTVGEDLIHLLEATVARVLKDGIDTAARGTGPTVLEEVRTTLPGMGENRFLRVVCTARQRDDHPEVVLAVTDVTDTVQNRETLEHDEEASHAELARLAASIESLSDTNRGLLLANSQLAQANDVLRAANDEHQLAAITAQTTAEELETYSEELQASNEEMETLNEELKATIEELSLSTADLDARTQDLALQREASETARRESDSILASMSDAVVVFDEQGAVLRANAAYDALLRRMPEPAAADGDQQPIPFDLTLARRAAQGESFTMNLTAVDRDGAPIWLEATGEPLSGGSATGMVVIRDISERQERLLQEQFSGMVAHQLRTPLTVLIGYLDRLVRQLKSGGIAGGVVDSASRALEAARRLNGLVSDLMDVARVDSGQFRFDMQPTDLVPLVEHAVEMARGLTSDQTIVLEAPTEPVTVNGDAARLYDAVSNLITNAVKYGTEANRIEVVLRHREMAEIEVRDHGRGIAPGDLERIFSRSYRVGEDTHVPSDGLGLGLFIAREIARAHGGDISVSSTLDVGSVFLIRIPLAAPSEVS